MPSFFSSKKNKNAASSSSSSPAPEPQPPKSPAASDKTAAAATSPDKDKEKKSKGYFVRDRDSRRPISPRSGSSFNKSSSSSRRLSETHPLNLPPEEIRRLSALSAMSSAAAQQENGVDRDGYGDPMETTPAPEDPPTMPEVNGVNGEQQHEGEAGPVPPPHRTPTSPSPQPEMPKVDAEACKAAGNKFYKAGQYEKAIEEYSKGLYSHFLIAGAAATLT